MLGRIIEISDPLCSLSLFRGFVLVKKEGLEISRIAIADIAILILNPSGSLITTNLLNALLENGIMVLVLGKNYIPSGIFYPTNPHHLHKHKIDLQISASRPLEKRLWQKIVQAKILNQATILSYFTSDEEKQLKNLASKVSSGDKENLEAQAAKKYWRRLFGNDFRRNFNEIGVNSALNYGYAILRSAMARAIFASGLQPAIAIHHKNKGNAFCLVDDLMEPFRPIVDYVVKRIFENEDYDKEQELTPQIKKKLSLILTIDLSSKYGTTPIMNCLQHLAFSFVKSLENKENLLELPNSPLPIELEF